VARFIGDTNLLRGTVVPAGAGLALRLEQGLDVPLDAGGVARAPGDTVVLSLRPERVQCPAGGTSSVRLAARVEEVTYLGDTVKTRLSLEGTSPPFHLHAKHLVGGGPVGTGTGDRVTVGWKTEDAWILPEGR
jgi:putative spermidine/putrescine transport system ATP-binding protein